MGCSSSQSQSPKDRRNAPSSAVKFQQPVSCFDEQYQLGKELGRGTYSIVRAGTRLSDKQQVAVKIVSKERIRPNDELALKHEVKVMRECNHPNILKLLDFHDEPNAYYLVLEYLGGGELFERLIQMEYYDEKEARDVAILLLKTIKYMHDKNIVHRDIKPENLILKSKNDNVTVKLADFGFAVKLGGLVPNKNAGSPAYVSPEVIEKKPVSKSMDMWSAGVVLFMLLAGYPPFYEETSAQLFEKIKIGEYEMNPECWDEISLEARDLVQKLLIVNPQDRMTVDEALNHPWLSAPSDQLVCHSLKTNIMHLKQYKYNTLLSAATAAAANAVIECIRNNSVVSLSDVVELVRKSSTASINLSTIIKENGSRRPSLNNMSSNSNLAKRPSDSNLERKSLNSKSLSSMDDGSARRGVQSPS